MEPSNKDCMAPNKATLSSGKIKINQNMNEFLMYMNEFLMLRIILTSMFPCQELMLFVFYTRHAMTLTLTVVFRHVTLTNSVAAYNLLISKVRYVTTALKNSGDMPNIKITLSKWKTMSLVNVTIAQHKKICRGKTYN